MPVTATGTTAHETPSLSQMYTLNAIAQGWVMFCKILPYAISVGIALALLGISMLRNVLNSIVILLLSIASAFVPY
jgi:hypothetical protein